MRVPFVMCTLSRVEAGMRAGAGGRAIGRKVWAIAEGYLPAWSHGEGRELQSHETACILNAGDEDAQVEITVYFQDRDPAGPYRAVVPAQRTLHLRFDELRAPEPIPRGTDFSAVIQASVPVVVQHTRLDTRQAESALMTTVAFAADG